MRIIDRPRLYRRLDDWRNYRAVVIHAPAGYGKSTLVGRWLEVSGPGARAAWLSLDEDDRDPRTFVHDLATALDRCLPGALAAVQVVLKDRNGSARRALGRLLAVFAERGPSPSPAADRPLILVLDDLQRSASPEIDALIRDLLEAGPEQLRLLLLARHRTSLPLARLYAHGDVLALDKRDLRFTADEVRRYLEARGFAVASDRQAAQLAQRSEGWVAGLQLAMLSVHEPGDVLELLEILRGDRDWLAAFLTEEVLAPQEVELRRFLLETSVLDGFDAALCEAVTGERDARARLAEIAESDLFLIRLEGEQGWFRYHHLFQELLQKRLNIVLDADAVAALHRRAASWLAANDRTEAAIRHWLAAGDEDEAAAEAERCIHRMTVRDHFAAERLFDLLPPRTRQLRPQLALERAWLALIVDDRQSVDYVRQAGEALRARGLTAETAPQPHGEWLVMSSTARLVARDYEAAASDAERASAHLDDLHPLAAGTLHFVQLHLHDIAGEREEALAASERALASFRRADFLIGTTGVQRFLATRHMSWGDGREATRLFRALLDHPPRGRPEITGELARATLFAAENSYWRNDLEQARRYQRALLDLARQLQDDALILCSETMGAIYRSPGAERHRPESRRVDQLERDPPQTVREVFFDLEVRRLLSAGEAARAWALTQRMEIDPGDGPAVYGRRVLVPYLRSRIACGVGLAELTSLLERASSHCAERGARFRQLQLLALTAWWSLRLHGARAAEAHLVEAARLAHETGYVGIVLEIPELAQQLEGMDLAPHREPAGPASHDDATRSTGPRLTERERQVLELLASERTYKQVSREMGISLNTVRTHVRHAYRKLSVKRRDQAIRTAYRLGLLDASDPL